MADSDPVDDELDLALEAPPAVSLTVTDQLQGVRIELRWGEAAAAPAATELVVLARMLTRAPTPLEVGLATLSGDVREEQRLQLVRAAQQTTRPK